MKMSFYNLWADSFVMKSCNINQVNRRWYHWPERETSNSFWICWKSWEKPIFI